MLLVRALRSQLLLGLCAICLLAPNCLADRIHVKNGSIIKGKAIVDDLHPDQYLIIGEQGKTPMVLKKDRVQTIEPEKGVLDDYVIKRKAVEKSGTKGAEDDYQLGVWCLGHKLNDLATVHFESAIKKNPNHSEAHQRLGHFNHEGRWLTASELKTAQGYFLVKGKWITAEEKEQRDAEASATAEQKTWARRLTSLKNAMVNGPENKSKLAEAEVMAIHEPIAVNPIVRVFGLDENPQFRSLASRALGGIPGPEASAALVTRLLNEPVGEVRESYMTQISRSKEQNIVPKLVQALKSESLPIINRAAWALGNLNAVAAVPRLIPALVSSELQTVWDQNGSGGNGINAGFSSGGPGGYGGFGMSGGQSIPILTGPAVGPGVVAFGATSVPASAFSGAGLNIGGAGPNRGATPRMVAVNHQNTEVLAALVKLTGRDFGYDVASWQSWMQVAFKPNPIPAKRVPQP